MKWAWAVGTMVPIDGLDTHRIATDLQFVKNAFSVKCDKGKRNKMTCTC